MKNSISARLSKAKSIYAEIANQKSLFILTTDVIMRLEWQFGRECDALKEEVGHGNWRTFISFNFESTIQKSVPRCMKLYADNPEIRGNSGEFSAESKRKFWWSCVPLKKRTALAGDRKELPRTHYLTGVNQFYKWRRQVRNGRAELPGIHELRRDFEAISRTIVELCGKDWALSLLRRKLNNLL